MTESLEIVFMRKHLRHLTPVSVLTATASLMLGSTAATAATAGTTTTTTAATTAATTPAMTAKVGTSGMASITFDDGRLDQYANARPALAAAGVKATFYVISDAISWGRRYMGAPQLRRLVADGHEIGNHTKTHADLTTLSTAAVGTQFSASQAAIRKAAGTIPTTCSYPHGADDTDVRAVAARYFAACRGTAGGVNRASGLKRYDLRAYYVTTSTTPAQVRTAAAQARANGTWIVFVFHGVGRVTSSDDVTTQSFVDELTAIKGTGIPIRTVTAAQAALL